jgi:hypothetical protein
MCRSDSAAAILLAALRYPDVIDDAQQNYGEPARIYYCRTAPVDIDS